MEEDPLLPCFCDICNGFKVPARVSHDHLHKEKTASLLHNEQFTEDKVLPRPPPSSLVENKEIQINDKKSIPDFLLSLIHLTTKHSVTQSFITDLLLLMRSDTCSFIDETARYSIPKSYDSVLRKLKLKPKTNQEHEENNDYVEYLACPKFCRLFPLDFKKDIDPRYIYQCECCKENVVKPNPRKDGAPIPRAIFILFPLEQIVQNLWANPFIAKQLKYGYIETIKRLQPGYDDSEIVDVMDGLLWKQLAQPFLVKYPYGIVICFTNDPIGIDTHFQQSCTPYFIKVLILPPKARSEIILTVGVSHRFKELMLEAKAREKFRDRTVKYQQGDLKCIVDLFNKHSPDNQPIMIRDGSKPEDLTLYPCPILPLFSASDLKALVHLNQQKSIGTIVGACCLCTIEGVRYQSVTLTIYVGHIVFLEKSNEVRKEYTRYMNSINFVDVSELKKPSLKDEKEVRKLMTESEKETRVTYKGNNGYLGESELARLEKFLLVRGIRNDFMHIIYNVSSHLYKLLLNHSPMIYNDKRKSIEKDIGRFQDKVVLFHFTPEDITFLEGDHASSKFPEMHGDRNKPSNVFTQGRWMKSKDYAFLASDYGIYLITISHIGANQKRCITRLLACLKFLRMTQYNRKRLEEAKIFFAETISLCEMFLPFYFFGINIHLLLHAIGLEGNISECGPPRVHQCYDTEQAGGVFVQHNSMKAPLREITNRCVINTKIKILSFKRSLEDEINYNDTKLVLRVGRFSKEKEVDIKDKSLLKLYDEFGIEYPSTKNIHGKYLVDFTINGTLFETEARSTKRTNHVNSHCKVDTKGNFPQPDYCYADSTNLSSY
jgi:hypothetical protein